MEKECKCSLIKENIRNANAVSYPLRRGKVGINIEKELKKSRSRIKMIDLAVIPGESTESPRSQVVNKMAYSFLSEEHS